MTAALLALALAARAQDTEPPPDDDDPGVIVVTASRTEQPVSETVVVTEVITAEDMVAMGADDAAEALELQPGVTITRTFRGAGVEMQGLGSRYVLVLVNGRRVGGRTDGVLDLSRYPVERIERIEIVKGASAVLYGSDAIAGVVNLILREPERGWSNRARATYGSRHSLRASDSFATKADRWEGTAGAGIAANDGFDWDPTDAQTDGDWLRRASVDAEGAVDLTDDLRVFGGGDYQISDRRGVDQPDLATFDRRNLTEQGSARLGTAWLFDAKSRLTVDASGFVFRDQYVSDQQGSDDRDLYEETRERLAQASAQADRFFDAGHLVSVGGEALAEALSSPRLSADGTRARIALFAQDEWRPGGDGPLRIAGGARFDHDSKFGSHPAFRLALRYDPIDEVAIRLNAGTGYRAPDFKELLLSFDNASAGYRVTGNEDLLPETSLSVAGGVEVAPVKPLRLRVDAFRHDLTNLIDFELASEGSAGAADLYQYANVASALTAGVESSVWWEIVSDLRLDLSHTWTVTRDETAGRPLQGRAPHRGTARLSGWSAPLGLGGSATAVLVSQRLYFADEDGDGVEETTASAAYALVGARVEKALLADQLSLFVGVDNALNAGDAEYNHLDPRFFYAGLDVRLSRGPR